MSSTSNSGHEPFMMPLSYGLDPAIESQLHQTELRTAETRPLDRPKSDVLPRWRAACAKVLLQQRPNPLPADHELFSDLDRKQFARAGHLFDVRRAYLAGLAAAMTNEPGATRSTSVRGYPVHLDDARSTPARRPIMQVQSRTSR